jgi:hypothetical protein
MSSFGFGFGFSLGGQQKTAPANAILTRASATVVTRSGLTVVGRS